MKTEVSNYELLFGSNLIKGCPRAVEFVGKGVSHQIIRFREGEDGAVLFNCKVSDPAGNTVAVVANSKVQHLAEGFRVSVTGDSIVVVREQPNEVLLEFVKMGPRKFKLNGHFVLPGYDIVATDNLLMVNRIQLSNNIFQNCSSAIGLG